MTTGRMIKKNTILTLVISSTWIPHWRSPIHSTLVTLLAMLSMRNDLRTHDKSSLHSDTHVIIETSVSNSSNETARDFTGADDHGKLGTRSTYGLDTDAKDDVPDGDNVGPGEKERKMAPAPIATFEEWTKEKLLNKEKQWRNQIPVTDIQENVPSKNAKEGTARNAIFKKGTKGPATVNLLTGDDSSINAQPPAYHKADSTVRVAQTLGRSLPIDHTPPVASAPERNYASKECGAKILLSNPEADHPKAVLNERERDEYMRNPCEKAHHKFLIVELCETIQPTAFDFANFELFSSGPKDIRISISERYPAAEWHDLGRVTAEDTREMQTFIFEPCGVYAKFIKIELVSHHGKEHYCTLSTIRVSGISMVDEYEAEAISETRTLSSDVSVKNLRQAEAHLPGVETSLLKANTESDDGGNIEAPATVPVLGQVAGIVGNLGRMVPNILKPISQSKNTDQEYNKMWGKRTCQMSYTLCGVTDYRCFIFGIADGYNRHDLLTPTHNYQSLKKAARHGPVVQMCSSQQSRGQLEFFKAVVNTYQCPTVMSKPFNDTEAVSIVEPSDAAQGAGSQFNHAQPISFPTKQPAHANKPTQAAQSKNLNAVPGAVSTHKESVFLKLNKRLSALELNISLSSEYLTELSRQYVANQDDYNKQKEEDRAHIIQMASQIEQKMQGMLTNEIRKVNERLDDLKRRIERLERVQRCSEHKCSTQWSAFVTDLSLTTINQRCGKQLPMIENIVDANVVNRNTLRAEMHDILVYYGKMQPWYHNIALLIGMQLSVIILGVVVVIVLQYSKRKRRKAAAETRNEDDFQRFSSLTIEQIRQIVREELTSDVKKLFTSEQVDLLSAKLVPLPNVTDDNTMTEDLKMTP